MKNHNHSRLIVFFMLIVLISLACKVGDLAAPEWTPMPTPEPPPADVGTPTGSSPMSGDWGAITEFGRITFRISPDGAHLETLYVEMNRWTCGGVTITTGISTYSDPLPTVDNGRFAMGLSLNTAGDHYHDISVSGDYDQDTNKFTGTWREKAFDTICEGTWQTVSRN
jgi:hypothetical protein